MNWLTQKAFNAEPAGFIVKVAASRAAQAEAVICG